MKPRPDREPSAPRPLLTVHAAGAHQARLHGGIDRDGRDRKCGRIELRVTARTLAECGFNR